MAYLTEFFTQQFFGIALWVYAAAFAAILVGFVLKKIVSILFHRLISASSKTKTVLDDMLIFALAKPVEWALALAGIFVALLILPLPEEPVISLYQAETCPCGLLLPPETKKYR